MNNKVVWMFKQKVFAILLLSYNESTNTLIKLTQAHRSFAPHCAQVNVITWTLWSIKLKKIEDSWVAFFFYTNAI